MKNKRKLLNLGLFFLSLPVLFLSFLLFKENNRKNLDMAVFQDLANEDKNYYLSPINLDFSTADLINYVSRKRPVSNIDHLREFVNDIKINKNIDKNWVFLTTKRIEILQGSTMSYFFGNYESLDQLISWHKENRPKDWEFWKYKELESWEGSLAEFYSLTEKEINFIERTAGSKTEMIERLVLVSGVLHQHQKRLDWITEDWPMTKEEREYLKPIYKEIISGLFKKIYEIVPEYQPNVYIYSIRPIIEEKNFGQYNLWFETNWFGKDKVELLAEISDPDTREENYFVEDRYGISIGNISIVPETKELAVKIQLPKDSVIDAQPKIWLKRITYSGNTSRIQADKLSESKYRIRTENLSSGQEKSLLEIKKVGWILKEKNRLSDGFFEYIFIDWSKYIYLSVFIIFLILSLLLGLNYLEKVDLLELVINFKKKLFLIVKSFFSFVSSKVKVSKANSSILVIIYTAGVLLVGKNWDFLAIWTFVFLTIFSSIWELSSNIHFVSALFLMMSSPVLIFIKREDRVETLAIFSFFLLLSGAIQKVREERRKDIVKIEKGLLLKEVIGSFFQFFLLVMIIAIILNLSMEYFFYKDFFGNNFIHELLVKIPLKIICLWLAIVILFDLIFHFLNKKLVGLNDFFEKKGFSMNMIFILLLFLSFSVANFFILRKIRESFEFKPYILRISKSSAAPGTLITIYGHNFLENKGKALLNGTEQIIKHWEDQKIVFEVTDEFSSDGKVQVVNNYERKVIESNGIPFTFIDTSPPAEFELDL